MARVDDLERVNELPAKKRAAPAIEGQGRQRRNDLVAAGDPAEIGLDASEGDDEARLDSVFAANGLQQLPVFRQFLPPLRHAGRRHQIGRAHV